jgi:hypothetical protein
MLLPAAEATLTRLDARAQFVATTTLSPGKIVAVTVWPLLSLIVAVPAAEDTSVTVVSVFGPGEKVTRRDESWDFRLAHPIHESDVTRFENLTCCRRWSVEDPRGARFPR